MFARLALASDKTRVMELAQMQVEETLPHLDFRLEIAEETFDHYLRLAEPTFFVVEKDRQIVAYSMCLLQGYAFTDGVFVVQEAIYVEPEHRGTRAAALLVKQFIAWGDQLDAKETIAGIANGFQPERTARFFEHFGLKTVGMYLKKVG